MTLPGRRLGALVAAATIALFAIAAPAASADELPVDDVVVEEIPTTDPDDIPMGDPNEDGPVEDGTDPGEWDGGDDPGETEAPVEPLPAMPDPVITVEQTVFPAGNWQDGIHVRGTGFDPTGDDAWVAISAGQGTLTGMRVAVAVDGTIEVHIMPVDQVDADTPERPGFVVWASQARADASYLWSNAVPLTITDPAPQVPAEAAPSEVAPVAPADADPTAETGGPALPETGADAGIGTVALALLAAGAVLAFASRRRAVSH